MQTDPHIIMISGWAGTVLDSGRSKKYLSRGVSDQKSFVILIKSPAITIIQDHFEVIYSHETCFWTEKHLFAGFIFHLKGEGPAPDNQTDRPSTLLLVKSIIPVIHNT